MADNSGWPRRTRHARAVRRIDFARKGTGVLAHGRHRNGAARCIAGTVFRAGRRRFVALAAVLAILVQTLVPNFAMASMGRIGGQPAIGVSDLLTGAQDDLRGSWCGILPDDGGTQPPGAAAHDAPCAFCLAQSASALPPDRVAGIVVFDRTGPPDRPATPTNPPSLQFLSTLSPRAPPAV